MEKLFIYAMALCLSLVVIDACAESSLDPKAEQVLKEGFAGASPEFAARLSQDHVQATCSKFKNSPPDEVAGKIEKEEMGAVKYPSGSLIGDWREGEKIAQEGRGLQFSDKPGGPVGGNCYACHQLAPKEIAFGTLGPSLYQYGKLRGNSEAIVRYTYAKIYDAQAFKACSNMPRFGHNGILTAQQIKDVVALLLDPDSPVNK